MSDGTSSVPSEPIVLGVGDEFPTTIFGPVTRTDFVRYAGASGDFNPVHHDELFASAMGLPSVFGMGLLHAGILGNRLARWVGPNNLTEFGVRFTGHVWPGDVLTFTGRVTALRHGVAELELLVIRGHSEPVLTGRATARVRPAP